MARPRRENAHVVPVSTSRAELLPEVSGWSAPCGKPRIVDRDEAQDWLDTTVVEGQEPAPAAPVPSVFDDVTEISSDLQMMALAQAEPVLIIHDLEPAEDNVDAAVVDAADFDPDDVEVLPVLDAEEFELAPLREAPLLRKLRLLVSRAKPYAEKVLASIPRDRIASAVATMRSKMPPIPPRLSELYSDALEAIRSAWSPSVPASTDDPDAFPLLAEKQIRKRVATVAVTTAVVLGVWVFGSRLVALFAA